MIDFDFEQYCCGCGSCNNICPVGAINMVPDKGGFLFPSVDKERCIQCGKCDRVCPHLNAGKYRRDVDTVRGVWLYSSQDDAAKLHSSSGGVFFELGREYIKNGQYVCGCIWTPDLRAVHYVGNTREDLERMQGSKYLQSNMAACYSEVMSLLKTGKQVLFSGTPCQAAAMHSFVMNYENGKYRKNLLTVAVICHGVPAPGVWESYKRYLENLNHSKLIKVNFRDKTREGYKKSFCRYEFESGMITFLPTYLPSSKYIEASLVYNLALRSCCAHCDCKGINEACDLIIGDWYAECTGSGELGTSCIVACTKTGYEAVTKTLSGCRKFPYNEVVKENKFIEKSEQLGANREIFFAHINDDKFWDNVERLYPSKYRIKRILVKLHIYELIKKIFKY